MGRATEAGRKPPRFRYNPLHDMESLWWIAVYLVINREVDVEDTSDEVAARLIQQKRFAAQLFHRKDERYLAITSNNFFLRHLPQLHPSLSTVGSMLFETLVLLCDAYLEAEKSDVPDCRAADDLHEEFHRCFQTAMESLATRDIHVRPFDRRL